MRKSFKSNSKILFFTIGFLILGFLYYWLFREPTIVSKFLGIKHFPIETITWRMDWFPSLVHQFTFSIFTWLVLEKKYILFSLSFWFSINIFFELGQSLSKEYTQYFPKLIEDFCIYGTYSHEDIFAIMMATLVAYLVMKNSKKKEES